MANLYTHCYIDQTLMYELTPLLNPWLRGVQTFVKGMKLGRFVTISWSFLDNLEAIWLWLGELVITWWQLSDHLVAAWWSHWDHFRIPGWLLADLLVTTCWPLLALEPLCLVVAWRPLGTQMYLVTVIKKHVYWHIFGERFTNQRWMVSVFGIWNNTFTLFIQKEV